jgi:hypothetical protein
MKQSKHSVPYNEGWPARFIGRRYVCDMYHVLYVIDRERQPQRSVALLRNLKVGDVI